jgi:hypothetical protein
VWILGKELFRSSLLYIDFERLSYFGAWTFYNINLTFAESDSSSLNTDLVLNYKKIYGKVI